MKKKIIDLAIEDGAIDNASLRTTVAHMMMMQSFALFDDAENILKKYGLSAGMQKMLANRAYQAFDKFFDNTKDLFAKEDRSMIAHDYDRINAMIEKIIKDEIESSSCENEYMICDVCGKKKHMSEFSKKYKHRCKECVNAHERARRRLKAEKDYDLEAITLKLDRKKMQARQIYPNTIIVPYDTAKKVIENVINHYKSKQ